MMFSRMIMIIIVKKDRDDVFVVEVYDNDLIWHSNNYRKAKNSRAYLAIATAACCREQSWKLNYKLKAVGIWYGSTHQSLM